MMEASAVVMRVTEVLRDGMLGTGVCNSPTMVAFTVVVVVVSTGVSGGLELLLDSAVLVHAIVVGIMGVLAVDPLAVAVAVAVTAMTRMALAVRTMTRASVVVAGRVVLHMVVGTVVIGMVARVR